MVLTTASIQAQKKLQSRKIQLIQQLNKTFSNLKKEKRLHCKAFTNNFSS